MLEQEVLEVHADDGFGGVFGVDLERKMVRIIVDTTDDGLLGDYHCQHGDNLGHECDAEGDVGASDLVAPQVELVHIILNNRSWN